jgi:hypothetical protein
MKNLSNSIRASACETFDFDTTVINKSMKYTLSNKWETYPILLIGGHHLDRKLFALTSPTTPAWPVASLPPSSAPRGVASRSPACFSSPPVPTSARK